MSDRDLQPVDPQDLVPEEYEEDYAPSEVEQNIVKIAIFFGGSVPLVGLTQLAGLGMPGFVSGAVAAAILAVLPPGWVKRVPGAQYVAAQLRVWRAIVPFGPHREGDNIVDADPSPANGINPTEEDIIRHMAEQHLAPESSDGEQPVMLGPIFPTYLDDETLYIGQAIDKDALALLVAANQAKKPLPVVRGQRFDPHIDSFLGKGMILAAAQGSGKSMLIGLVIEQAGRCDAPSIIFDHKGEYPPLAELTFLSVIIAGGASARKKAEKMGVPYFELTTKNADDFVAKIVVGHHQAIIPLPSYGESWLARAEVVAEVGQALMRYSARCREEEKDILPCLVLLDEAQLYIPQNAELLPPEAKENRSVLNNLSNAFFSLVSNGRSNGYTMCYATQSLTYIAKWAIKSCQIKVILRHVEHNDLETCEDILGKNAIVKRADLETLPPGVGIVFNLTPKPLIVQFDTRKSRDESETPGVARLRAAKQTASTKAVKIGDLSLEELVALLNQARPNADDPRADAENGIVVLGQDVSISRELYHLAVHMRKNGISTGYRDLMVTFKLTEHFAKALNRLIEEEIKRENGERQVREG